MHRFLTYTLSFSLLFMTGHLQALGAGESGSTSSQPTSAAVPPIVVELFTSEGCSSCPPADALLQKIHLKTTAAGQLIVGISEHVAYWDSLGWKDPFASEVLTERQVAYAARLSREGPYTPQMVINGREQLVGSDTRALAKALQTDAPGPHVDLRIASATVTHSASNESGVDLQFSLKGTPSAPLDLIAIVTDDADRSNVLRGENSGKALQHISVARLLVRVATAKEGTEQHVHLKIPKAIPLGAGSGHHLILLAQEQHQGAILGVALAVL